MNTDVRLVELLAGLSLATDLGMGQPAGHAGRSCLLAMRIAAELGVTGQELSDVYYVALLRYLGCTADSFEVAALVGDEIVLAQSVGPFVMGAAEEHAAAAGLPRAMAEQGMTMAMAAHCEAAELLASRLVLGPGVLHALRHGFERWDGAGHPAGLSGEAIPLPVRIAVVARDAELWHRRGGEQAASGVLFARRGNAYDPAVVDAYLRCAPQPVESPWPELSTLDPNPSRLTDDGLNEALTVFADFADGKLPYALGHSREVATLCGAAAELLGMAEASTRLYRAGLLHDLGRVGVTNRVWDKPGPLTEDERESVRMHPYLTERIAHRCGPLGALAELAGSHHERLDGSGYHRGSRGGALTMEQRLLAAADAYCAMRQQRPHRPALSSAQAIGELTAEVEAGRLDGKAARAVVAAAGELDVHIPVRWPGGLTDREVEVLGLACRGLSIDQVARRLVVSGKTVDRHLQNAYAKIGVSTRASAAIYAVSHGLLTVMG